MSKESENHLAEGQRAVALKKYSIACEHFAYLVEGLNEEFGELAPETGDALILYAKALLSNAIASSAVLGGPTVNKEEEETPGTGSVGGEGKSQFHFEGDAEDSEEEEEEEPEEEEVVDDFEMAFSILEMARATYTKMDGIPALKKLAQVHRLLGDVAMESERFEESLQEFGTALAILDPLLLPHDRSFSELNMLMALALDNIPDSVPKAVAHAEKAKNVLILRIAYLEGLGEKKTETDEKELIDIKELIGDVENKIQDLKVEAEEIPKTAAEQALEEVIKSATGKSNGVVNNLNSLVKRKKPVAVVEESEPVVKRKGEEIVEGEPQEKKVKV